jgi:hypothetical protein
VISGQVAENKRKRKKAPGPGPEAFHSNPPKIASAKPPYADRVPSQFPIAAMWWIECSSLVPVTFKPRILQDFGGNAPNQRYLGMMAIASLENPGELIG